MLVLRAGLALIPQPSMDLLWFFFQFVDERGAFDEAATQMSKQNLAIVFAPNLFHGHGKTELETTEDREAQQLFVVKMLSQPAFATKPRDVVLEARKLEAGKVEKMYAKLVPSRKRSRTAEKVLQFGIAVNKAVKGTKRPADDGGGGGSSKLRRGNSFKKLRKAASTVFGTKKSAKPVKTMALDGTNP